MPMNLHASWWFLTPLGHKQTSSSCCSCVLVFIKKSAQLTPHCFAKFNNSQWLKEQLVMPSSTATGDEEVRCQKFSQRHVVAVSRVPNKRNVWWHDIVIIFSKYANGHFFYSARSRRTWKAHAYHKKSILLWIDPYDACKPNLRKKSCPVITRGSWYSAQQVLILIITKFSLRLLFLIHEISSHQHMLGSDFYVGHHRIIESNRASHCLNKKQTIIISIFVLHNDEKAHQDRGGKRSTAAGKL